MQFMHAAVGILRNANNQILIAKRPLHKYKGGLWEFPGGKIEPGESALDALKREFKEELNIEIIAAESFMKFEHDYSERRVLLDTWLITEFSGEPCGMEGQEIQWVSQDELSLYEFPEGNCFILDKLK